MRSALEIVCLGRPSWTSYPNFLYRSGSRRSLGDMSVQYDIYLGKIAVKIASLKKELEDLLAAAFAVKNIRVGVLDHYSTENWDRRWYGPNGRYTNPDYKFYQDESGMTNVKLNRAAKTNNPIF